MVFDLLDEWLPESVVQSPNVMYAFGPNLQTSMAQLLTAFPAFLWVMRLIGKGESEAGSRSATAVTRWLTYISLFLTATTAICDLMVAVEYALRGELTVRFVLKVLTVLVAAGGVFLYFFEPLRTAPVSRLVWARPLSALAVVLALAAFGGGLAAAGSPSTHRKVEADRRRVQDLTAVAVRWIFRN